MLSFVLRFLKPGLGEVADQLTSLRPKRLRNRRLGLHILFDLVSFEDRGDAGVRIAGSGVLVDCQAADGGQGGTALLLLSPTPIPSFIPI